jgi:Flp pilus assembly protein TadD
MADTRFPAAEALHLERIQLVNHSAMLGSQSSAVHDVYAKFGEFLLIQLAAEKGLDGGSNTTTILLNRAREALALAFVADEMDWQVGLLYACVLIELDQQEQSEVVLNRVIEVQLSDSANYTMKTFVEFDGYETDSLCPINPKCYAVLAALFSIQNLPLKARKALSLANRSFAEGSYAPAVSTHGSPRRTIVLCLSETSLYLFQFAMTKLAQECVKLALESETAVTAKATARGKAATTVPYIKHLLLRVTSMSLMNQGSSLPQAGGGTVSAEVLDMAVNSELVVDQDVDKVQGWIAIAAAQQFGGTLTSEMIESYLNLVQVASKIPMDTLKGEQTVPLKIFVQGGNLLISTGRFNEAVSMLLFACSVYSSSTLFSLLGVSLLRLDRLAEAEDALIEANLLDYRNPEVWAYLSLLCLTSGPFRTEESDRCLFQALRLGLSSSTLLRELATANMAADKLQTAEDLVRRAIRCENRQNPRTRKLLADILASQNQAVGAIEEYQGIISDDTVDKRSKLEAAEKCAELLTSLGRHEELKTLSNIIHTISQESGGE